MVPGWTVLDQFEIPQFLDKMEEAGVKHLAFGGPPPVVPDPKHYEGSVVPWVPPPAEVMARADEVKSLLAAARDSGMKVFLYGTNPHMCGDRDIYGQIQQKRVLNPDGSLTKVESYWGVCANAPELLPFYRGRIQDARASFPEINGFLNDGPEFGYEILPGLKGDNWSLFNCFGPCCERKANELGYDFEAFKRGAGTLMQWFRSLDLKSVLQFIEHDGEPIEALAEAAGDPGIVDWFQFKRDSINDYIQNLCDAVKGVDPNLKMGVGSRLPAFTPYTGYDLGALAVHADFLLPKIYLWMGGYDGLYGTFYRWVKTLKDWNRELPDSLLIRCVQRLFEFELPGVKCLGDLTRHIELEFLDEGRTHLGEPFPKEFFDEVVHDQVHKMIESVGDAERVCPWLHTSHGGRILTPHEIDLALAASVRAGLKTYLFYCPLEHGNWEVAVKYGHRPQASQAPP